MESNKVIMFGTTLPVNDEFYKIMIENIITSHFKVEIVHIKDSLNCNLDSQLKNYREAMNFQNPSLLFGYLPSLHENKP